MTDLSLSAEQVRDAVLRYYAQPARLTDSDIEILVGFLGEENRMTLRSGPNYGQFGAEPLTQIEGVKLLSILVNPIIFAHKHRIIQANKRIEDLEGSIASLRAELANLKTQQRGLIYKGVWTSSAMYSQGDCATWGGSLWAARVDNVGSVPSEQHDCWQLCVRRGKDGKDAR